MKILFISIIPPFPTNRGGNQRTCLIYRALDEIAETDLICLYPPERLSEEDRLTLAEQFRLIFFRAPKDPSDQFPWRWLAKAGFRKLARQLAHNLLPQSWNYAPDPEISEFVAKRMKEYSYDAIVCRYTKSLALSGIPSDVPCLLDVDDLDTQKYESRLGKSASSKISRFFIKRHLKALNAIIPPLLERAQHLWLTNEEDKRALEALGATRVGILPNIPFPATVPLDTEIQGGVDSTDDIVQNWKGPPRRAVESAVGAPTVPVILAVCSMRMSFNEHGINHFVQHNWPSIKKAVPAAEFHIVGSMMNEAQKQRWSATEGVHPLGTVDDLYDEYRKSAFSVTPVSEGGGSKIKIAESLSYGRTCVITEHALRGYENLLVHEESLLVAHDDKEFVSHCIRLLKEPHTCEKLATHGQQVVNDNLSESSFRKIVQRDIREAIGRAEISKQSANQ